MANFRTKARAIDLLGRNQIADLPTAITELWKNGYDAYGDYLDAGLYRAGYKDVKYDMFTLSDDGFGMNQDDILNKWIVIGTDNKKREDNVVLEKDRFGKKLRVPLGEKGIGRLSVTYLGNHMLMITKKENEPYQLLFMNWKAFENYDLYLDEVEIPTVGFVDIDNLNREYRNLQEIYLNNFRSESWDNFVELKADILDDLARYRDVPVAVIGKIKEHYAERKHGTYFVIFDPIKEILELETEQDDNLKETQEEIAEQTKYVRSALSGLFNPFDEELTLERQMVLGTDFSNNPSVQIYSTNNTEHDFLQMKEFFTPEEFKACEHWIDGYFDASGVFEGEIKVFGKIEKYKYIPRTQPRANIGKFRLRLAFWEGNPANSSMAQEIYSKYEEKGENFSGLYVYRDGFRVLPYGRTDFDFLEFEKRRSNNAGRYYFSHRKMIGFIGITKKGNKNLIDKSGREGFVSNEAFFKDIAYEGFAYHVGKIVELKDMELESFFKEIFNEELLDILNSQDISIPTEIVDKILEDNKNNGTTVCHKELVKLNERLTINRRYSECEHKVAFGDVFYCTDAESGLCEYWLCITAKCDCAKPEEKIRNNYIFIGGRYVGDGVALTKAETDYYSFINTVEKGRENPVCIQWCGKINSIYIEQNEVLRGKEIIGNLKGVDKHFVYLGNVKENYAQRMANMAFANGNRVGVSLAKL